MSSGKSMQAVPAWQLKAFGIVFTAVVAIAAKWAGDVSDNQRAQSETQKVILERLDTNRMAIQDFKKVESDLRAHITDPRLHHHIRTDLTGMIDRLSDQVSRLEDRLNRLEDSISKQ